MATLLYPGKEFRITHQEMIKGIRKVSSGTNYRYVIKQWGLAKSESLRASPAQRANERVWGWRSPVQANQRATKSIHSKGQNQIRIYCHFTLMWIFFFFFLSFQIQRWLLFFDLRLLLSMMSSFDLLNSRFASIAKPDGNFTSSEHWPCAHYSSGRRKKVKSLAAI